MATQLADTGAMNPPPITGEAEPPRDYEAEARKHGWRPQEEFRGDPDLWKDAQTYVEAADEEMPLLKKKVKHLEREYEALQKSARRMESQFSKAEERIRTELRAQMEEAVELGDKNKFRELQEQHDKLATTPSPLNGEDPAEQILAFREQNSWYDKGALASASELEIDARLFADREADRMIAAGAPKTMPPSEFYRVLGEKVDARFPGLKKRPAYQKPPSDVAGVTRGAARTSGRSFNELPPEAQKACDKWVKQGLIKDRAAYVASYDWN